MKAGHALLALAAVARRELTRFVNQTGRLASAVVRPALWLIVVGAGFQNVLGISITPPYETYVTYQVYMVPGLMGIVLLFQGMQSSLSMVYDREMGVMRLLLTAPLPRWYLLLCKLLAGVVLSVLQAYVFLIVAVLVGIDIPVSGFLYVLPALLLSGIMMGALGLLMSVTIRQLENFAGTMNFVIFPMFFLDRALSAVAAEGERRRLAGLVGAAQSFHLRRRADPLRALRQGRLDRGGRRDRLCAGVLPRCHLRL